MSWRQTLQQLTFHWLVFWAIASTTSVDDEASFWIGTGIYDITGPAAQIPFMGYARTQQQGHGIHMRLRSRAFIMAKAHTISDEVPVFIKSVQKVERLGLRWHQFNDDNNPQPQSPTSIHQPGPEQTVCFVSADIGMGSDLLTLKVVKRLEQLLPKVKGKPLCRLENLSISGTHTHSAPGGFLQYALYQINTLGYSEETMNIYVEGITQSILRAYNSLQPGFISVAEDLLLDSNINRSPSSYLLNPQEERDQYAEEGDTDKRMLQLQLTTQHEGKDIGILNWFAVHGTSMNRSNLLISGDNKGYASYLMEEHYNINGTLPGQGEFVAAFASTNLGDVSPNTDGAVCIDTGLPCDMVTSSCRGKSQLCRASGPGIDMFESTEIIGRKQFYRARTLLHNGDKKRTLEGEIEFRHSFIDMSNLSVSLPDGQVVHTCPAALGYGFAGGTTDGPGFDFTQGSNSSNPFWDAVAGFLSRPTKEQVKCHYPKPILLNTGQATAPYRWDPNVVPISVFRVGSLFILNVPAELTTMAGRRLRKAITDSVPAMGVKDPIVTIAGLSNSYTHYVATIEEYEGQRYEAASTLYGPHTLSAYIQEFVRITTDLLSDQTSATSGPPADLSDVQISLIPDVVVDTVEVGTKFGSVVTSPEDEYTAGEGTAVVSFRSANPRNNPRTEGTFLTVDKLVEDGSWETKYVDGDWCTRFAWSLKSLWGDSFAEISWQVPADTPVGSYRICHFGARKELFDGSIKEFSGCTKSFLVKRNEARRG